MKKILTNRAAMPKRQHGISLIEVLVTVLILAIGSLGVASLQLAGLKYSSGSYARTQAIILADDMANRLKTNRAYALNLDANGSLGAATPYQIANFGATVTSTIDCNVANCSPVELANHDMSQWLDEVARVLPAGQGRLRIRDRVNTAGGTPLRQFEISLQWRQVANSTTPNGDENNEVKDVTYRVTI